MFTRKNIIPVFPLSACAVKFAASLGLPNFVFLFDSPLLVLCLQSVTEKGGKVNAARHGKCSQSCRAAGRLRLAGCQTLMWDLNS